MKRCIAITEVLTRTVIVETKEADADSLENAIECVREAYNAQKIVLDADDLAPDPATGESAHFYEADWVDPDEIQKKDADFTL